LAGRRGDLDGGDGDLLGTEGRHQMAQGARLVRVEPTRMT
jgi:hypothetical protein